MARPLHVLHLTNSLGLGGAEKRLSEIVENLPREEFQFTVGCVSRGGEYEERIRATGTPVEILGYRPLRQDGRIVPGNLLQPLATARRFQALVDRHRPDVVHAWLPICNVVAGRALSRWRYRRIALIASRILTGEYRQANPLIPLAEMLGARRAEIVYCNSGAVAADVISSEPWVDASIIRIVRNGVDTRRFHPAEDRAAVRRALGIDENARVIVVIAALRAHKGHAVLLEALGRLLYLYGGQASGLPAPARADVKVYLVGADQGEGEPLRQAVERLGLRETVEFAGPRRDVPQWMQAADLLVLPSLAEGLPNVLLEAQASGLPCVATRLPGCEEALGGEQFGRLVPPNDPQALAGAMGELLDDAAARQELARKSRAHVEQEHGMERMFERFVGLYREAAGMRGTNRKGAKDAREDSRER